MNGVLGKHGLLLLSFWFLIGEMEMNRPCKITGCEWWSSEEHPWMTHGSPVPDKGKHRGCWKPVSNAACQKWGFMYKTVGSCNFRLWDFSSEVRQFTEELSNAVYNFWIYEVIFINLQLPKIFFFFFQKEIVLVFWDQHCSSTGRSFTH